MNKKWLSGMLSVLFCITLLLDIAGGPPAIVSADAADPTQLTVSENTATIYYYTPSRNWSAVNLHHNASGSWTTVPGTAMEPTCTNWVSKTVSITSGTSFQAVFNNGSGSWDNNGGNNYTVSAGTHQVKNGQEP